MSFNLISGYSCSMLSLLLAKHLNVPILKMFGHLSRSRKVDVLSAEIPKYNEIFIIEMSCIELNNVNDALLELMLIINFCRSTSNAKINVGKL